MNELSVLWQEWTTPYSLELIKNGILLGVFAGISEGYLVNLLMKAMGMFDIVMIYSK
ncbi:MAG: hypothetical protein PHI47_05515 [Sulfuricurvum sp.]|uniref:hypothetical protein n=1 Tax=Sulfuricurvum sp. TaxID=2025608 RepID=UPI002603A3BA|nr:hypothetical protein [Sulfuricurvum sp.]MDD5159487.1 hypothetical protein [Sulfuricurvum sp.]